MTVSDIVTRRPPATGVTDVTFLVSVACALLMLATAWYTQVLPIATGNGAEAAVPPVAPVADALAVATALALDAPAEPDALAAGLPPAAVPDVLAAEPHPASVIAARPARTARADMYLPMWMPRSVGWRREAARSEEHTSELQSHVNLVCRLLL